MFRIYMKGYKMSRRSKWKVIEENLGNLEHEVPKLLNEHQSQKVVATLLGISEGSLHGWLKNNNSGALNKSTTS